MADLKTDYKDDVLDVSVNEKRKWIITENGDGTVTIEDATTYSQTGDIFGSADLNAITLAVNECFQSVSNGKALVASAITDKKVPTDATATFAEMEANIREIRLGSGNATAADVKKGKTFTNDDGVEYTGTYDFAAKTSATATAKRLTKGYTAWVNGKLITGERIAPVTKLSGTFELWIPLAESVTTKIVEFSTPFDKVPTVSISITGTGNQTTTDDWKIDAVTRTNFTFSTRGKNWKYVTITVKWVAEA